MIDPLMRRVDSLSLAAQAILNNNGIWLIAVCGLFGLQLTLIFTHEPWLDEWQALQIALQSSSLRDLLENLRYEGHPPPWYFLLQAVALVVPPGWILSTLQAMIALTTQAIIVFRSPFNRLEKLLIGSSFFVLFDYGTLSRSLSLGVMLLTLFFAFRHYRLVWLVIAMLPMTDFLFGVLSIGCLAIMTNEKRLWWPGTLLWTVSGLIAAWTVVPAPDMLPALPLNGPFLDFIVYLCYLSVLLIPLHIGDGLQWNLPLPVVIAPTVGLFFIWFAVRQSRMIPLHLVLCIAFLSITALFSILVYPLSIRHLSLAAYLLILLKWRERQVGMQADSAFFTWLWVISLCGLLIAGLNLIKPFDTAAQAASYIRQHRLEGKHWLSFPDSRAQGISALLGIEFHRLERDCTQSFIRWNYRTTIKRKRHFERELHAIVKKYGRVYMVTDFHVGPTSDPNLLKPLARFQPGYNGQKFYLYVVAPDQPESNLRPPKCAPADRKPLALWPRDKTY